MGRDDPPLGTDAMAHQWQQGLLYAFPPFVLLHLLLQRVQVEEVCLILVAPNWPQMTWFSAIAPLLQDQPWELPVWQDLLSQAQTLPSLSPGTLGLAPERAEFLAMGLAPSVVDTLQGAQAPSTRTAYAYRWEAFRSWCNTRQLDPLSCGARDILQLLQEMLEAEVVLSALRHKPFEPLETVGLQWLSLKTAFLLAIVTAKRIGELHALSVHEECCRFLPDDAGVVLRPNPAFHPKVWSDSRASQSFELHPFNPPQGGETGLSGQSLLCPVRALKTYIRRTEDHRSTDQLFVCYRRNCLRQPVSKARLSHWMVDMIQEAYAQVGRPAPTGVRRSGLDPEWSEAGAAWFVLAFPLKWDVKCAGKRSHKLRSLWQLRPFHCPPNCGILRAPDAPLKISHC
ncbi:hypothetical protein N1851_029612 [Merluccius polli]|uniref:Uncharacterized protein n=1 Tax=Merluccius polli TaxID=89951 RepID=A0AA47M6Z1_MERPO|nr:hypothetical protein N1851_029612 [Merluccius polli]